MRTLRYNFLVLKWGGLWRPPHWPPGAKSKLYDAYTWLTMILLVTVILSQLAELLSRVNGLDDFAGNTFILLILIADCGKAVNILIKRRDIMELTNSLTEYPCRPRSEEEVDIQKKYDRMIRINSIWYMSVVWGSVMVSLTHSCVFFVPRKTLPFNSWLPFDYGASWLSFAVAYVHQTCGIIIGASVSIAFDTLVPALMLQTRAQLNILMHRFDKMPGMLLEIAGDLRSRDNSNMFAPSDAEVKLLSQRIEHHIAIFKFAEKSNDLFGIVIFLQYAVSTYVLCVSLLRLSREKLFSSTFMALFVYLAEMGVQIALYCFYGGEVTIESLKVCDAVYEMDWPALSVNTRRSLLTIMARTLRPITFTTGHVVTLNLESFKSLVKLSYSTYNVLSTQENY